MGWSTKGRVAVSGFKPLKEEEIWKLLEGQVDVLTPLAKQEEAMMKARPCPSCGSYGTRPFVSPTRPFVPGNPLPNKLLRCDSCETEFNPYTGFITKAATRAGG